MTKPFFLADISPDSPTVRHNIREETVDEYADHYRSKRQMPPVVIFADAKVKKYYLADGAHRCAAVALIGRKAIDAIVQQGDYEAALSYALQANAQHGLPRSSADKRKCIREALKQWPKFSNAMLSKVCDVDDHTVADVRKELEVTKVIEPTPRRVSSRGTTVPSQLVTRTEPRISEVGPKPVVDKNGTPIPKAVIQYWERAIEVTAILAQITEVMNSLKQAETEKDLMFAECNLSAALGHLENARSITACAAPHAVCTQCQGHPSTQPKGECRLCFGRGVISKFRFERLVPSEIQAMVIKGAKK